jgi:prepilin-type N-terminal cleavage/methylation domain-containing protein
MMKIEKEKGMSLLEILVVVAVFAVLGILVTRSVILTLQGVKKTESLVRARENLDYSLGIIERQLRNASAVPQCPNTDSHIINYLDQNGTPSSFSCIDPGGNNSFIASGSGTPITNANLTTSTVNIVSCSFTCTPSTNATPPVITISLGVQDALATGIQGSVVTADTQISLRNY